MKEYTVYATHTPRGWWVLEEPTLGAVSQTRSLADAEKEMREPVAYLAGVAEKDIKIHIVPILPNTFNKAINEAMAARKIAEEANKKSAQEYRIAARSLRDEGITLRDIGTLLNISYQRASQLAKEA